MNYSILIYYITDYNVHQWLSNIIKHMNPDFICSPFNLVRIFVLFKTKSSLWPSKLILSRTSFLIFAYVVKISVSWFIHSTSQKFNVNWIMSLFPTATLKKKTVQNQIKMQLSKYSFLIISIYDEIWTIHVYIALHISNCMLS